MTNTDSMQAIAHEPCRISADTDKEFHVYYIDLPDHLSVHAARLKRFAYDHDRIRMFIAQLVNDNIVECHFEPWSDALQAKTESRLRAALDDLTDVFDTADVTCDRLDDERIQVTVRGEYKNGELDNIRIPCVPNGKVERR